MPRPRIYDRICQDCGGPVKNPYAKLCRACWGKNAPEVPRCVDCGKKLGNSTRPGLRCRACHNEFIAANRPITACTMDGCEQPFYAKGMCRSHYQVGRRTALWGNKVIDRSAHYTVKLQPCAVCGYSRMRSEVHRIIPKGPYIIGNMVPLCSRCHDEVERGLTPCPPAWQPQLNQVELPL